MEVFVLGCFVSLFRSFPLYTKNESDNYTFPLRVAFNELIHTMWSKEDIEMICGKEGSLCRLSGKY